MSPDPPTESKSQRLPKFAMLFVVWLVTLIVALLALFMEPLRNIGSAWWWVPPVPALWTGGFFSAKIIHHRSDWPLWIAGGFIYGALLLCSYVGLLFGYCALSAFRFH